MLYINAPSFKQIFHQHSYPAWQRLQLWNTLRHNTLRQKLEPIQSDLQTIRKLLGKVYFITKNSRRFIRIYDWIFSETYCCENNIVIFQLTLTRYLLRLFCPCQVTNVIFATCFLINSMCWHGYLNSMYVFTPGNCLPFWLKGGNISVVAWSMIYRKMIIQNDGVTFMSFWHISSFFFDL